MPADPRTRDEIIDAMRAGACPLCVLVERAERKAIDHFLYDQVNDISRRDTLRTSRGYCLSHTAMLSEGRSALGIAILNWDILRAMIAELERGTTPEGGFGWFKDRLGGAGAQVAARVAPQAGCPMCAARPQIEEPLIIGLLRNLDDATFLEAFRQSDGLCRVHLVMALRTADAETSRALASIQAAQWRRVEATLDEFIRKHDYRFKEEVFEEERDVWLRALRLTSGWYDSA